MKKLILLSAAVLLYFVSNAFGGDEIYRCNIDRVEVASVDQDLKKLNLELAQNEALIIDRNSGRAHHVHLGNTSYPDVRVLNRGNNQWSYRAIAENPSGGAIYYEVAEFHEGEDKPLLIATSGIAFLGSCK